MTSVVCHELWKMQRYLRFDLGLPKSLQYGKESSVSKGEGRMHRDGSTMGIESEKAYKMNHSHGAGRETSQDLGAETYEETPYQMSLRANQC